MLQAALLEAHGVLRDTHKMDPGRAFDALSKVLFLKSFVERWEGGPLTGVFLDALAPSPSPTGLPAHEALFQRAMPHPEAQGLFAPGERLDLSEGAFRRILALLEPFDLRGAPDDVKRLAYERLLVTTFRGSLGQYFTPHPVVDFAVALLSPREGGPSATSHGLRGFLVGILEHLRIRAGGAVPVWADLHGADTEPRAAQTAKINLFLHGGEHRNLHHHDGLVDIESIFPRRFDLVLTNPPFGSKVGRDQKANSSS